MTPRAAAFAAAIILASAAWLLRYDITPTAVGTAYRLDRWTGHVDYLKSDRIRPLTPASP